MDLTDKGLSGQAKDGICKQCGESLKGFKLGSKVLRCAFQKLTLVAGGRIVWMGARLVTSRRVRRLGSNPDCK